MPLLKSDRLTIFFVVCWYVTLYVSKLCKTPFFVAIDVSNVVTHCRAFHEDGWEDLVTACLFDF